MKRVSVRRYYGFQFAFSMLFWAPIFFDFQKKLGLSEGEIFRIQSLDYIAFCFVQVPTGYFADRVGHLASLRLGAGVLILSHLFAFISPSFQTQLIHWLLLALARSLVMGASSAYLYEFLQQKGQRAEYQRIEGKARALTLYGRVACFAVVGYLMEIHLYLPYVLTLISAGVALWLAFRLPRIPEGEVTRPELAEGLKILMRSPFLVFLMFQGVVIFVLGRIVTVNLFQPILLENGIEAKHFGLWMGILTLAEAYGSMSAPVLGGKVLSGWTPFRLTFLLSFGLAICLLPIGMSGPAGVLALLLVFSLLCGWAYPIQRQLINDAIPGSQFRATFLGLESILDRAICAGVAVLLEKFATDPTRLGFSSGAKYGDFFFASGWISLALLAALLGGYGLSRQKISTFKG